MMAHARRKVIRRNHLKANRGDLAMVRRDEAFDDIIEWLARCRSSAYFAGHLGERYQPPRRLMDEMRRHHGHHQHRRSDDG